MKVLIVGVNYFHYAASLVRACELLGHEVINIWITEFRDSENSYWKIRAAKLGLKIYEIKYNEKMNKKFIKAVEHSNPDCCIILNGKDINNEFLKYLKKQFVKTALFMIDSIQFNCYNQALKQIDYYDKIFSYEPSDIHFLSKTYGQKNAKYSFLGYDETIFHCKDNYDEKEYDICFVGALNMKRFNLLEAVAEYAYKNDKKMIIYTNPLYPEKNILHKVRNYFRSNKIKSRYPHLSKILIDKPIYDEQLADLYRNTKICINIHSAGNLHSGPNPRTFEILGCGSFELVDSEHLYQVELKSGEHLVEFENETDLCKKIDYYLENDEERKYIAYNGYKRSKEKYTMKKCVENILMELVNNG
ncbi:CgeB family protein [Anaerosinus massiliensis]|uniref:CgeB family protein n=1 Tax=Massilibacillus massiliensis TaxID=1806837 RepID=UPI000DA6292F|nr:glycosyltransferase [Massilibacillus massiliensis]